MTSIDPLDNSFYADPRRLEQLKGRAGLEAAAGQFEAMFLQMVLKNMRAASQAVADEDSFLSSQQQQLYQSMADGQLASLMAKRGDLGIADALIKQFEGQFKNSEEVVASQEMNTPAFQQPLNRPRDPEES